MSEPRRNGYIRIRTPDDKPGDWTAEGDIVPGVNYTYSSGGVAVVIDWPWEREAATVPPSDPPGDLRAAVPDDLRYRHRPGAEGDYREHGTDVYHIWCDAAKLLAIIDAHRCYDEAALAEALRLWTASFLERQPDAYYEAGAAAIIERLRSDGVVR
jgi:hypothetical protein